MLSEADIEYVLTAARQARDLLLDLRPQKEGDTSRLGVVHKTDGSPVSAADEGSNKILLTALRSRFPGDRILSEEEDDSGIQHGTVSNRVWIIDPLDGTRSFISGRDDFSILISLWIDQKPYFGLMLFPVFGFEIVAVTGRGAFCNDARLSVSSSPFVRPKRLYVRNANCERPELASPMMDSGLALFKVASGELDGAIIQMTSHREWDVAAPAIIILEAGGLISDEHLGPIICGSGTQSFRYFVASNRISHGEILDVIRPGVPQ